MKKLGTFLAVAALALVSVGAFAQETVTLPEMGVEIPALVTALLGKLSPILISVAGAALAIFAVTRGIKWVIGWVR